MAKVPVVAIVACLVPEMGIGFQGSLPWRLSQEMKYFREVTSRTRDPEKVNAVVMGRRTWESIPQRFRPLPNRINTVVSRQHPHALAQQDQDPVYRSNSLTAAVSELQAQLGDKLERIYIIGGGDIYNQSYDLADHWLITKIRPAPGTQVPEMDTFLDANAITSRFQERPADELARFVPVSTPTGAQQADPIREKGYEFWFTLYSRAPGSIGRDHVQQRPIDLPAK